MAANYAAFDVLFETTAGQMQKVGAGVSVKVRIQGAGSDASESPLTTDADGHIASGSIAAASAGTVVHFRVENYNGMSRSVAQTLT